MENEPYYAPEYMQYETERYPDTGQSYLEQPAEQELFPRRTSLVESDDLYPFEENKLMQVDSTSTQMQEWLKKVGNSA